jgi:hypothetical protein
MKASQMWDEMGANGTCPIEFTAEETCCHKKGFEEYNEAWEHFEYLRGLVGTNEEG